MSDTLPPHCNNAAGTTRVPLHCYLPRMGKIILRRSNITPQSISRYVTKSPAPLLKEGSPQCGRNVCLRKRFLHALRLARSAKLSLVLRAKLSLVLRAKLSLVLRAKRSLVEMTMWGYYKETARSAYTSSVTALTAVTPVSATVRTTVASGTANTGRMCLLISTRQNSGCPLF
jgi:hypothetical protein